MDSFEEGIDFTTGALSLFIASGDLDGDGKPDLVTANFNANTISVLRNTTTLSVIDAISLATKVDIATATVTVPHSASINLGATFTMEAWVKYSGRNVTIFDKGDYDFCGN